MLKNDYIRLIHMFFSSKKSILYQIFGLCIKGKINHKDTENTKIRYIYYSNLEYLDIN